MLATNNAMPPFPSPSVVRPPSLVSPSHSPSPAIILTPDLDWATFWKEISATLTRRNYRPSTRSQYRTVLRGFYRYARCSPMQINESIVQGYLSRLVDANTSWNWLGMNISILRHVFDKLAGRTITARCVTPKRPHPLPEILSREEALALLAAAPSTRDQLMLGLLYGCGLKVGELCRLRWADVDTAAGRLRACGTLRGERMLHIPPDLLPVLMLGKARCPADDYIFQGRYAGSHLSGRIVEMIVRKADRAAGILKPVTAMSLRHTFAVHSLENGQTIRAVQDALGHRCVKTTLRYNRCTLPETLVSPLDRLRQMIRERDHWTAPPPPSLFSGGRSSRDAAPVPDPVGGNLFKEPLSLDSLELPFRDETTSVAAGFYQLLKTHVFGRFLCLRRPSIRSG